MFAWKALENDSLYKLSLAMFELVNYYSFYFISLSSALIVYYPSLTVSFLSFFIEKDKSDLLTLKF